jgi:hypothetical protein
VTVIASRIFFGLGVAFLGSSPVAAAAQDAPLRISIGSFTSQQRCTLYAVTSGSEAMVSDRRGAVAADAYGYAAASRSTFAWARAWRTELVRDCVSNFTNLRNSVTAALAASGRVTVVPPGTRGALVLTGRVSDVGVASNVTSERGNDDSVGEATLTVEVSLAGAGNGVQFGGSIVKTLTFDEQHQSEDYSSSQTQSDSVTYSRLQRELAFAVSRAVAFHLSPIRVIGNSGRRLRVNYGTPLLTVGGTVNVDGGVARGIIRGTVVAAGTGFADVEAAGGGDLTGIRLGSIATFAEPEDPGSRTPVFPNVELPN